MANTWYMSSVEPGAAAQTSEMDDFMNKGSVSDGAEVVLSGPSGASERVLLALFDSFSHTTAIADGDDVTYLHGGSFEQAVARHLNGMGLRQLT